MSGQPTLTYPTLAEATLLRRQASDLLVRLQVDRESAERRMSENGRRDPIKAITGATALEKAIASTREMIAQIDLMLAKLENGLAIEAGGYSEDRNGSAEESLSGSDVLGSPSQFRPRGMLPGKRRCVAATA